jgi:hypothetical protein
VTPHLAAWAIALWQRDRSVLERIARCGTEALITGGQLTMTGPSGIRGAVLLGDDPNTCAVMLGFLFLGQLWPKAVPDLQKEVNRLWKKESKEARASA